MSRSLKALETYFFFFFFLTTHTYRGIGLTRGPPPVASEPAKKKKVNAKHRGSQI